MKPYINPKSKARWSNFWGDKVKKKFKKIFKKSARQKNKKEINQMEKDKITPDTKQNFISVDKKTARNSYGIYYTVGETVKHSGAEDTALIMSFELDLESNEVRVLTSKGHTHVDFLIKIEDHT